MNEAISACRFSTVKCSYKRVVAVSVVVAITCLAWCILNQVLTILGFIYSLTGGMAGTLMSMFSSKPSSAPMMPWDDPMSYPAIGGIVRFTRVTFANFRSACGGKETVIFLPNLGDGDIFHPTELSGIVLHNVTEANKMHHSRPSKKWINPSDCVDMDCDALRKIVIKDIDGSMFGTAGGSVISRSEYQWGGDRSFGLGRCLGGLSSCRLMHL